MFRFMASKLEDAPWPATKDELIDYAMRSGAPLAVSYTHLDVYKRQMLTLCFYEVNILYTRS